MQIAKDKFKNTNHDWDTANNKWTEITGNYGEILDQSITDKVGGLKQQIVKNNYEFNIDAGRHEKVSLVASITLATGAKNGDYNFINLAEILEFTSENGRRNKGNEGERIPGNENPADISKPKGGGSPIVAEEDADISEEIMITKSTGEDRSFEGQAKYYYLMGIIIQITVIAGIAFVKKYKL